LRDTVLDQCSLKQKDYTLNQIRYDLRKLRLHGLIERIPHSHAYRFTQKGYKLALLLIQVAARRPPATPEYSSQPHPVANPDATTPRATNDAPTAAIRLGPGSMSPNKTPATMPTRKMRRDSDSAVPINTADPNKRAALMRAAAAPRTGAAARPRKRAAIVADYSLAAMVRRSEDVLTQLMTERPARQIARDFG
jgi:hypothetical protein